MKKRIFIGLIPLLLSGAITSCYGNNDKPIEEEKKEEEEKPQEKEEVKQYVITWKDYDGTILATSTVKEGVKPTYPKTTPTREADEDYTYEFANWNPSIVEAKENTTYTATYTSTPIEKEIEDGFFYISGGVETQINFKSLETSDNNYITLEFNENDEYIITSSSIKDMPSSGKLVIPSRYNGKKIVGIAEEAFSVSNTGNKLVEIVLPSSLKTIGDYAFSGAALTSLTLPSSLEKVGYCAFDSNTSLTTVNINCPNCDFGYDVLNPEEGEDRTVGGSTFYGCEALEEVNLPNGMSVIAPAMFVMAEDLETYEVLTSLTNVTLPSTIKNICSDAFQSCEDLTSIELPEGLERIGFNAFIYAGLESITLPSSLTYCGSAFVDCESLQYAIIKSPSSKLQIVYTAFGRSAIETIYYEGSESDFNSKVEVLDEYDFDDSVPDTALINSEDVAANIEILYYSETSATNSWHYVNNVPTRW